MSTHRNIDRICVAAVVAALILCILFMNGETLGISASARSLGYEERLFDTSTVHTINIEIDDWDSFLDTCESEEYSMCTAAIDGESFPAVGIRGKGNTSLKNVSAMDSDRYSFKLEFDQYDSSMSYYGLDKLCLNNIIQDNTYMKDYLAYTLMANFGVDAPLCSFVYITVNGEDWGLYLAVEGVENSFITRNYSGKGEMYKPDSMDLGGGRGNGKDFNMDDFKERFENGEFDVSEAQGEASQPPEMPNMPQADGQLPEIPGTSESINQPPEMGKGGGGRGGGEFNGGMDMGNSDDVKLKYIDDDPDSYSNIFLSAKTDVSEADKKRLIMSLKNLSAFDNLEDTLDIDKVLRYFVVHNFVVNGDSYTGSMIHNYYLHEQDGKLSMIPWDYNLAYGTFMCGNASSAINDSIDDVLEDRPMQAWIFSDESYTEMYHKLFSEFIESADFEKLINEAYKLIAPYVEKDPTKFCTYEEFESGVAALRQFCALRSESVKGQLDGTIPSTQEAQQADDSTLIGASDITLSVMGTMDVGGGRAGQSGNMTGSPGEPRGAAGQPGELPDGEMPQNGTPPKMSQGDMEAEIHGMSEMMPTAPDIMVSQMPGTEAGYEPTYADCVLLAVCAVLLSGGTVFALKYRQRREIVSIHGQVCENQSGK